MLHFAYPILLLSAITISILSGLYKFFLYKPSTFNFSLVHFFIKNKLKESKLKKHFSNLLRFIFLILLSILIGKPQLIDKKTNSTIEGIDIILDIDVSGSMQCFDDLKNQQPRIEIALNEASKFINKRINDQIGFIIFGKFPILKAPLTNDKKILQELLKLNSFELSEELQSGTMLGQSLLTALNRLKNSKSATKIIILLTDGEPTPGDIEISKVLQIATELGVKIYTIGIGAENSYFNHPIFGIQNVQINSYNPNLLKKIAEATNATFFEAKNSTQLQQIYNKIDKLEKTKYEISIFTKYTDFFMPILFLILFLILLELVLSTFIFFII